MNSRTLYSTSSRVGIATLSMVFWFVAGMFVPTAHAATGDADDPAMVDCMLPGQIQRLNNNVMIMGARHPVRATRADCHVRGGEYHDPAPVAAVDHPADEVRVATVHRTTRTHRKIHRAAKTVKPATTQ